MCEDVGSGGVRAVTAIVFCATGVIGAGSLIIVLLVFDQKEKRTPLLSTTPTHSDF